jgi:hypothetical protein
LDIRLGTDEYLTGIAGDYNASGGIGIPACLCVKSEPGAVATGSQSG